MWFSLFAIFSARNRGDYVCRYWIFYLSSFIFKESHALTEEHNPSEKIVIVKEELDGIDIETLRIYWELCSFIKNVGILKDSLMVESSLKILMKRKKQAFYKLLDVQSVTIALGDSISSINIWNIVNQ